VITEEKSNLLQSGPRVPLPVVNKRKIKLETRPISEWLVVKLVTGMKTDHNIECGDCVTGRVQISDSS
jgi:hypothetical protein